MFKSQIQAKREKGLCLYCDEKYTFSHKCKPLAHVLIVPDLKVAYSEDWTGILEYVAQQEEQEPTDTLTTTP